MVISFKGTEKNWDIVYCVWCFSKVPQKLLWTSPSVQMDGAGGGRGDYKRKVASGQGRVHPWQDGPRSPC